MNTTLCQTSIQTIDGTLTSTSTPSQSAPGSNGNEGVPTIGVSLSDVV